LAKLRGTNLKVQQEIRETDMFETVMQDIVEEIETHNLSYIAICCNRGHHRSVACAEMLKYLYSNAEVNHLTVSL
jgi:RNase adaptor protein for sRNA GlmZ degradation